MPQDLYIIFYGLYGSVELLPISSLDGITLVYYQLSYEVI